MYNRNISNTCLIAALFSAIIGIGIAVLFSLGFIANIIVGLWIVFSLSALLFTIYSLFILFNNQGRFSCLRRAIIMHSKCLLAGTVGSILAALVALSSNLVVSSTVSIITIFFVSSFFAFMLITFIHMLFFLTFSDIIERQS